MEYGGGFTVPLSNSMSSGQTRCWEPESGHGRISCVIKPTNTKVKLFLLEGQLLDVYPWVSAETHTRVLRASLNSQSRPGEVNRLLRDQQLQASQFKPRTPAASELAPSSSVPCTKHHVAIVTLLEHRPHVTHRSTPESQWHSCL